MYHDFFIKHEKVFLDADDVHLEIKRDTVRLDDDFIWYIYDSLKWISFYNPSRKEFNPNYALESPTILQRLSAWVFAKYLRFTRR